MTAPVNSVDPAITGTVTVGTTLTLGNGTWLNTPTSYAYAWLLAGAAISGATASTYTVLRSQIGLALSGRVTATNADGSAAADSAAQTVPGTLIPEDGTALSTADSYTSLADANTYHAVLGNAAWAALSDADKESALRRATKYITSVYRARWKGYAATATQALTWPREFAYREAFYAGAVGTYPFLVANDIVPVEVKDATASLALRASTADLAPDLDRPTTSESVGSISVSYQAGAPQYVRYREVDLMLAAYLAPAGVKIERA